MSQNMRVLICIVAFFVMKCAFTLIFTGHF